MAESYQPGVSVSVVARRHDLNTNQLFTWRRHFRELAGDAGNGGFVPVVVEASPSGDVVTAGRMEIALPGGVRVIGTAKLNDVDSQAWLADILRRIADTPQSRLDELLPWNWVSPIFRAAARNAS